MSIMNRFDWVVFYEELASKLLPYKENRQELITKVYSIYETTGIKLPTLERKNKIVDIDPFTVFGLFNKSSMKEENRIKIISEIAQLFEISAPVPTSFDSVPVLNNQNATFYYFVDDRDDGDIDDLWGLFESALTYAHNSTLSNQKIMSKYFDSTINKKGNGNSKITMGIYWISPNKFLNLDSRNEWYIYSSGKIPEKVVQMLPEVESKISSTKYFEIVDKIKSYLQSDKSSLKNFRELSYEAWRYSEEVNRKSREEIRGQRESKGAALADEDVERIHYWVYAPGNSAAYWEEFYKEGIMAIGWDSIGDLSSYTSKDDMKKSMKENIGSAKSFKNAAYATWQFANEIKPGDIVFAKKGMHLLIGRGVVESDYEFDDTRNEYKNIRRVKWTDKGEWPHPGQAAMKTLTDITSYTDYVEKLNKLFESDSTDDIEEREIIYPHYGEENFLEDVYMDEESYNTLVTLLRNKKNVILQGVPGVGKTYVAKRLAYSIMGVKDRERVMMVQFHQSYSYEDFIMGFRPSETGFELRRGVFYNFCKAAEIDLENEYFFIIDEINRGNLSKIFGELFMLIENDKRGVELQLLYSDEKFSVPNNIHIIGMMNTADRSLAMLDYALRRRFAFYEMSPAFETDGFMEYCMQLDNPKFDRLIQCVMSLNNEIAEDESLGEGFCIGHSYFCNIDEVTDKILSGIVEFELIPLLKEYWFDESDKVKDWSYQLRSAIR